MKSNEPLKPSRIRLVNLDDEVSCVIEIPAGTHLQVESNYPGHSIDGEWHLFATANPDGNLDFVD